MRCSGSSLACAALGCERAGDVNHECIGAVMGPPPTCILGVASGGRRDLGVSVSAMGSRNAGTRVRQEREEE